MGIGRIGAVAKTVAPRVGRRAKQPSKPAQLPPKVESRALDTEDEDYPTDDDEDYRFPVTWNGVNFQIRADGGRFYGSWRKTKYDRGSEQIAGYAVDIWCEYKEHHYTVESIPYYTVDPKANLKSLNADICAAVSRFLYNRLSDGMPSIEDLRKSAAHPIIHVKSLETLDRIIMKLHEFRDTAIRSGGTRYYSFKGDNPKDPEMAIEIDITSQAIVLKGKPPPMEHSGLIDDAVSGLGRGRAARVVVNVPDPSNVQALVQRLRETTDKAEGRKIRSVLRKMGHRGGSRGFEKASTKKKA